VLRSGAPCCSVAVKSEMSIAAKKPPKLRID
jgi:hypothetical protein